MSVVRFDVNANVPWKIGRGQEAWIAICDPLSMTLEADTFDQIVCQINEAMHDFFVDMLRDNELEQFLRTMGWRPMIPIPHNIPPDELHFDVPFTIQELPPENPAYAIQ